jgi:hypothetical protein
MDEVHATTTLTPPLQLGITFTASICTTAAHCSQSTSFSNSPRMYNLVPFSAMIFKPLKLCVVTDYK